MAGPVLDYEAGLRAAIDALYETFARYRLRADIEACPCCTSEAMKQALHGAPLRELGTVKLDHYTFKAMTTWGDVDDFRHFLPRILELLGTSGGFSNDAPDVLSKLTYGNWRSWPAREQHAIEAFIVAWGRVLLSHRRGPVPIAHYAMALTLYGQDIERFLLEWRWRAACELVAALHLADLASEGFTGCYWDEEEPRIERLRRWLADPALEELLIDRALGQDDPRIASELESGANQLRARRG